MPLVPQLILIDIATARPEWSQLSMIERGAYEALRAYAWDHAGLLPDDWKLLYRAAGATTNEEKNAMDRVIKLLWRHAPTYRSFENENVTRDLGRHLEELKFTQENSSKLQIVRSKAARIRWQKRDAQQKQQVQASEQQDGLNGCAVIAPHSKESAALRHARAMQMHDAVHDANAMQMHMQNACKTDAQPPPPVDKSLARAVSKNEVSEFKEVLLSKGFDFRMYVSGLNPETEENLNLLKGSVAPQQEESAPQFHPQGEKHGAPQQRVTSDSSGYIHTFIQNVLNNPNLETQSKPLIERHSVPTAKPGVTLDKKDSGEKIEQRSVGWNGREPAADAEKPREVVGNSDQSVSDATVKEQNHETAPVVWNGREILLPDALALYWQAQYDFVRIGDELIAAAVWLKGNQGRPGAIEPGADVRAFLTRWVLRRAREEVDKRYAPR